MLTKITITVVVCAHTLDRLADIRKTIASLDAQSHVARSLVIVCDHSEALHAVLSSEFPDVAVVRNVFEKGLSGARNTGIREARGDVVAFLDDDASAEPDWLEKLAAVYADPMVMAAGGSIEPVWSDRRPAWFPPEFDWVVGCSYPGLPLRRSQVRNLIGCNMSVRRTVFSETDGFHSGLGRDGENAAGCEETEFFIRISNTLPHQVILYEPEARVRHHIPSTRSTWKYFLARCRAEGRSKAAMVRIVGGKKGLESERGYVTGTLPAGFFRYLGEALRCDLGGLARAFAILTGLTATASAYLLARMRPSPRRPQPEQGFLPVRIVDWNLDRQDITSLQGSLARPEFRGGALCLFRSKGDPVAVREFHPEDRSPGKTCPGGIDGWLEKPGGPQLLRIPTGPRSPWLTVVVATRDRPDSLYRCLNSLLAQTYRALNIIVVDNAPSSNATADLVACLFARSGRVRYVREERPGLGVAHNAGLAEALGEVIAFTDDDVIADPDWAAAIASEFAQSPKKIGCVTGMILPAELETRAQYWTERHGGFGKGVVRRVYDVDGNRPEDPLFPYNAGMFGSGANMAFSREALMKIGGFDAALGAGTPARGGDDLASFVAVLQAGYQLVYEPRAIVWHFHRRAEAGMRRQAYGYGVGLGAYLTRLVLEDPHRLVTFGRKLPAAFAHLFSRNSHKLQRLPADYPRQLVWRERFGILMGVPGYLRSRYRAHKSSLTHASRPILAGIDRAEGDV